MNAPPPYGQQPPPPAPPGYSGYQGGPPPGYPAQGGYPGAGHGGPPKKKGMSGCMIALIVVGALFVVGGLAVGVGIYAFASSDQGKKIVNAVASGAQLAAEAQNAPGAAELRALGCQQAMIMDASKVQDIVGAFADAGPRAKGPLLVVMCQVKSSAKAPTCEQVASTYVTKVGRAAGPFEVVVEENGGSTPECKGTYDAEGKHLATTR